MGAFKRCSGCGNPIQRTEAMMALYGSVNIRCSSCGTINRFTKGAGGKKVLIIGLLCLAGLLLGLWLLL